MEQCVPWSKRARMYLLLRGVGKPAVFELQWRSMVSVLSAWLLVTDSSLSLSPKKRRKLHSRCILLRVSVVAQGTDTIHISTSSLYSQSSQSLNSQRNSLILTSAAQRHNWVSRLTYYNRQQERRGMSDDLQFYFHWQEGTSARWLLLTGKRCDSGSWVRRGEANEAVQK